MPIPKGTRDFGPSQTLKRKYILNTITQVFESYGFLPLETPAMENLETLTGKYGEEGDQLIFKILNNGDFLKDVDQKIIDNRELAKLSSAITGKALRYDLTVPFARFVSEHRHEITFPFRRYQIQNVWRADRPQRGRYREFLQCDADIIGTNSLVSEIELIKIFDTVFNRLNLQVVIKINNRKVLSGFAKAIQAEDKFTDLTIAIDKMDKVGLEGVEKELIQRGFEQNSIQAILQFLSLKELSYQEFKTQCEKYLEEEEFKLGIEELDAVFNTITSSGLSESSVLEFDPTLARGLNYYTGAIFEVKCNEGSLTSSICGGGRYDNLTGIFGLPGVSGVGISFGADRIYDILLELNKFPESNDRSTRVLLVNFSGLGQSEFMENFQLLESLRKADIPSEIYPDSAKLKKQFEYADKKGIPFVAVMGGNEITEGVVNMKNMQTGEQEKVKLPQVIDWLKAR
ncbi:MAG: histidine--tRNA ligase [Bacteroidia bacterium]|nr:histidine--tRNA ligase [Bacteroidia bacterium]